MYSFINKILASDYKACDLLTWAEARHLSWLNDLVKTSQIVLSFLCDVFTRRLKTRKERVYEKQRIFIPKCKERIKKEFYMHMRGAVLWWIIWRKEGNVLFSDALNTFYLPLYGRKEGNVLFNDALNTFYLRLYGVRHMVKDNSDSERGNLLPPHRLLFPINSKGSFICTIPQTGLHIPRPCYTSRGALAGTRNISMGGSFECILWVFSVDVSLILTLPTYLNRLFTPMS